MARQMSCRTQESGCFMTDQNKQWWMLLLVVGAVIALDQVAKWLTVNHLSLGQTWDPIPAISPFIRVMRSHNTGAAFGMFPMGSAVFLILAVVTVVVFLVLYPQLPAGAWLSRLSMALIIGGAISNAIDRVRFGYVVDYVYVKLWGTYSNISNFADHAITLGVILLLIDQWRYERTAAPAVEETGDGAPLFLPPDPALSAEDADLVFGTPAPEEMDAVKADVGLTDPAEKTNL